MTLDPRLALRNKLEKDWYELRNLPVAEKRERFITLAQQYWFDGFDLGYSQGFDSGADYANLDP